MDDKPAPLSASVHISHPILPGSSKPKSPANTDNTQEPALTIPPSSHRGFSFSDQRRNDEKQIYVEPSSDSSREMDFVPPVESSSSHFSSSNHKAKEPIVPPPQSLLMPSKGATAVTDGDQQPSPTFVDSSSNNDENNEAMIQSFLPLTQPPIPEENDEDSDDEAVQNEMEAKPSVSFEFSLDSVDSIFEEIEEKKESDAVVEEQNPQLQYEKEYTSNEGVSEIHPPCENMVLEEKEVIDGENDAMKEKMSESNNSGEKELVIQNTTVPEVLRSSNETIITEKTEVLDKENDDNMKEDAAKREKEQEEKENENKDDVAASMRIDIETSAEKSAKEKEQKTAVKSNLVQAEKGANEKGIQKKTEDQEESNLTTDEVAEDSTVSKSDTTPIAERENLHKENKFNDAVEGDNQSQCKDATPMIIDGTLSINFETEETKENKAGGCTDETKKRNVESSDQQCKDSTTVITKDEYSSMHDSTSLEEMEKKTIPKWVEEREEKLSLKEKTDERKEETEGDTVEKDDHQQMTENDSSRIIEIKATTSVETAEGQGENLSFGAKDTTNESSLEENSNLSHLDHDDDDRKFCDITDGKENTASLDNTGNATPRTEDSMLLTQQERENFNDDYCENTADTEIQRQWTKQKNSLVDNNDVTKITGEKGMSLPEKEVIENNYDPNAESTNGIQEKQQQQQQQQQQEEADGSADDASSSSGSSSYSSDTENEDEETYLTLMQRRERNIKRHQFYRNSLFSKHANQNTAQVQKTSTGNNENYDNIMKKIDGDVADFSGRHEQFEEGDERSVLVGRKRRRGMLFRTSHNRVSLTYPTNPTVRTAKVSIASTEASEKTPIEELNSRYPYRSPQIRQLHSIITSTIRQSSGNTRTSPTRAYVPSSIFVTGPSGAGKSSIVRDLMNTLVPTHQNKNVGGNRSEGGIGYAYVNCATLEPSSIAILLDSAYGQIVSSGFAYHHDDHVSATYTSGVGTMGRKKRKRKDECCDKKKKRVLFNEKSKPESNDVGETEISVDTPMSSIILGTPTVTADGQSNKTVSLQDHSPNPVGMATESKKDDDKHEVVSHDYEEEDEEDIEENHYNEDMEDTIERQRKHGKRSPTTRSTSLREEATATMTGGGRTTREKANSSTKNNKTTGGNVNIFVGSASGSGGGSGSGTGSHGSGLIVRFGRALVPFCGAATASIDDTGKAEIHHQRKGCAFLVLDHADRLLSLTSKQKHEHHISTNDRNNFLVQLLLLPKVMELNLTIITITNNTLLEYSRFNNILAPQAGLGTIRDSIQPVTVHFHAYRGQKIFKTILRQPRLRQLVTGTTDLLKNEQSRIHSCAALREKQQRLNELLYNSMAATLIQSLESSTRDVREFLHLSRILWPQYISPIVRGDSLGGGVTINMLLCSFPSDSTALCEDKDCLHCASYDSLKCQDLMKTRANILELLNKKVREFLRQLLAHNLFMPGRGGPPVQEVSTKENRSKLGSMRDLPYQSKFLLMSGYLCQTNKADRDAGLFTNQHSAGRGRKSVLSNSADNLAYGSKNSMQHIRSTRLSSFPLERMFSIFSSILKQYGSDSYILKNKCNEHDSLDVGNMGTYHLFLGLAQLRDLGLLREVSSNTASSGESTRGSWEHIRMEHTKYSCTLSREEANELAESLKFPISDYIRE